MWLWSSTMSRMSLAESSLRTWPSVQSLHSIRNTSPGRTEEAAGMSGCHRLCPGTSWSRIDLDWSTRNTVSGMSTPIITKREVPT